MTAATIEYSNEACCTEWLSESICDAEKLLIRNVTLCGNESKNGYKIPPSAFKSEQHVRYLYEGKHVYLDHNMDRSGRTMNPMARSVKELAAVVENVKFTNGKPRGDFRCFKTDPGRTLFGLAESNVKDVGPSHVAAYEYSADRKTVDHVAEVATVDIVCFPATTRNFTEQTNPGAEQMAADDKLNAHLESKVTELQDKVKTLEQENIKLAEKNVALETFKDSSTSTVTKLTEERDALKLKVDAFESTAALDARRSSIVKQLKDAKLNPEDKAEVSDVFMESLVGIEDEAKRKAIIVDRAESIGAAKKGSGRSGGASSTERRDSSSGSGDSGGDKKFDAAERWKADSSKIFAEY